jgi:WD40 repeat protein
MTSLASGVFGQYKTVTLWDAATGRAIATLSPGHGDIDDMAISPDGHILATFSGAFQSGTTPTVQLWNV